MKKAGSPSGKRKARAYWNPRPFLKFVDAHTSRKDWENSDPYVPALQKANTRGWFLTTLPGHIAQYSPQHTTRRELLELARMKDPNLLHVCNALVCDLINEGKTQAKHEIKTTHLWSAGGQEYYFDTRIETAVQPLQSATLTASASPDFASATQLLVKDKRLRSALPKRIRQSLELLFRKLDSGMDARNIISSVAADLNRDQRTVRRHLATARAIAADLTTVSGQLMATLERVIIPDARESATATRVVSCTYDLPDSSEENAKTE
jgi:hypothetical protein